MYCLNCGAFVPTHARFCNGCGVPVDTEATRLAARPAGDTRSAARAAKADEHVIFTERPTLLFIRFGYAAAAVAALLLTVLLARVGLPVSFSLLLALFLLLIPAFRHLKRNMLRYTLTDSKLEIAQGFLKHQTRNIPLGSIQDVTVSMSIPQRLLGIGDISIDDASEQGGRTLLHNISDPRRHAEMLLTELRRWR